MAKNKMKSFKKRQSKINLVFDEEKRRDFLSGFHKRKLQRKKEAKAQLDKQLTEEKKRLKAEARESYKKLVKSYTPVPEVEHLLTEEYEDENVNVKVIELSTSEIAKQNNWLGANQPIYTTEDVSDKSSEENEPDNNDIPGMALTKPKSKPTKDLKETAKNKTKAQIKHLLKKKATKNVQKSKPFQMKNKLERQKQKKKSDQMKRMRIKIQDKISKKRGYRGKQF